MMKNQNTITRTMSFKNEVNKVAWFEKIPLRSVLSWCLGILLLVLTLTSSLRILAILNFAWTSSGDFSLGLVVSNSFLNRWITTEALIIVGILIATWSAFRNESRGFNRWSLFRMLISFTFIFIGITITLNDGVAQFPTSSLEAILFSITIFFFVLGGLIFLGLIAYTYSEMIKLNKSKIIVEQESKNQQQLTHLFTIEQELIIDDVSRRQEETAIYDRIMNFRNFERIKKAGYKDEISPEEVAFYKEELSNNKKKKHESIKAQKIKQKSLEKPSKKKSVFVDELENNNNIDEKPKNDLLTDAEKLMIKTTLEKQKEAYRQQRLTKQWKLFKKKGENRYSAD